MVIVTRVRSQTDKEFLLTGFEINASLLVRGKLKSPKASYFSAELAKLTMYSILNNIKQDHLEMQFRSAFAAGT